MRPQVGKRAKNMEPDKKVGSKSLARQFVENKIRYNMATKEDYLTMRNVAIAINMNALEQRNLVRLKVLKLIQKGGTPERLTEILTKELDIDKHRLTKYYGQ